MSPTADPQRFQRRRPPRVDGVVELVARRPYGRRLARQLVRVVQLVEVSLGVWPPVVLGPQPLGVRREPLVEPDVRQSAHRDAVAVPLVGQLVRDHPGPSGGGGSKKTGRRVHRPGLVLQREPHRRVVRGRCRPSASNGYGPNCVIRKSMIAGVCAESSRRSTVGSESRPPAPSAARCAWRSPRRYLPITTSPDSWPSACSRPSAMSSWTRRGLADQYAVAQRGQIRRRRDGDVVGRLVVGWSLTGYQVAATSGSPCTSAARTGGRNPSCRVSDPCTSRHAGIVDVRHESGTRVDPVYRRDDQFVAGPAGSSAFDRSTATGPPTMPGGRGRTGTDPGSRSR